MFLFTLFHSHGSEAHKVNMRKVTECKEQRKIKALQILKCLDPCLFTKEEQDTMIFIIKHFEPDWLGIKYLIRSLEQRMDIYFEFRQLKITNPKQNTSVVNKNKHYI